MRSRARGNPDDVSHLATQCRDYDHPGQPVDSECFVLRDLAYASSGYVVTLVGYLAIGSHFSGQSPQELPALGCDPFPSFLAWMQLPATRPSWPSRPLNPLLELGSTTLRGQCCSPQISWLDCWN